MTPDLLKRGLDLTGALVCLVLLVPLLALVALLVRVGLGRPVLFRQIRPGLLGRPFTIYKFRTMNDRRNAAGELLPSVQRLTRFGRLLRGLSLDELPELFNVLKGEMSLVGPRPLMWHYLPRYSPTEMRRHDVKPGITGWAQVHGRNALPWSERFALDLWYVEHRSVWLDLKILAMTLGLVFTRTGVTPPDREIMDEFWGSEPNRDR